MSDSNERQPMDGPPVGMRRADENNGQEIIDASAGRVSVFGFGYEPIADAIKLAAGQYLGDAAGFSELAADATHRSNDGFQELVQSVIGSSNVRADSIIVTESADAAVEAAIRFARGWKTDAYRTIALIGSDHGRTAACRAASGRPELHEGFGPMIAGFAHVPANDIDALRATLSDQTACVLLSPIDLHNGAKPLEEDYLMAARELCDQHQAALIIDETRLCFGATGQPFTFASISDIKVDGVILSGGLFAGLPGGIFVGSERLSGGAGCQTQSCPLQSLIAAVTLTTMHERELPQSVAESSQEIAVAIAEEIGGFEFVRDIHASGLTIGIETDISAKELIQAALTAGLRIECAGETAVRIQAPLIITEDDQADLIKRLGQTLQQIERETADVAQS